MRTSEPGPAAAGSRLRSLRPACRVAELGALPSHCPMSASDISVYGVVEGVGLLLMVTVWHRRRGSIARRLVWSVVLLLPILGPAVFLMSRPFPEEHPLDGTTIDPIDASNNDFGSHGGDSG